MLREKATNNTLKFELDVIGLVEPDTLLFVKNNEVTLVRTGLYRPPGASTSIVISLQPLTIVSEYGCPTIRFIPVFIAAAAWYGVHKPKPKYVLV